MKGLLAISLCVGLSAVASAEINETADWQRRIDAVSAAGGGCVVVPAGTHVVASLELKSGVTLELSDGATLLASTNRADYLRIENNWKKLAVLYACGATNIAVVGSGRMDGRGDALGYSEEGPGRWRMIHFRDCTGVTVENIRIENSNYWTTFYERCRKVVLRGLVIRSQTNLNNDGIDLEVSDALVENCDIDTDDDAVCFKSHTPTFVNERVEVRNCRISSHCNCIKFGTATHGIFRDIDVHDCTLLTRGTPGRRDWTRWPGVDTYDWAISGIAIEMVDGGQMERVKVRNIDVKDGVMCPVFIRHGTRRPTAPSIPGGVTFLRDVLVENVRWTSDVAASAARLPISITGVPGHPVENVTLRNVSVPFVPAGRPGDEKRVLPENERAYPEAMMFGRYPVWGLYARHVRGLKLEAVDLRMTGGEDLRPKTFFEDVRQDGSASETNPCDLRFVRVASRRFVLDNERPFEPTSLPTSSVARLAARGLRAAGGFCPAAHYRVRVTGPAAAIVFADAEGNEKLRFDAPQDVAPPYDFSVLVTGRHKPAAFVTKGGETSLAFVGAWPADEDPRRRENLENWRFCVAGACESAQMSLSAGVGQADVRFVTRGRENALYVEDGRLFFTFSARAYGSYQAVASFDPVRFDVRLEGVILFDYGDGLLRNDLAAHLFYDDVAGEWRAYVSNFSTGSDALAGRAPGGVNVAWSAECPLRGLHVMRAKSLGLDGMNEDPCVTWDSESKKWRLLVSRFPEKGEQHPRIRAQMLESNAWDGPFVPLTDCVAHDSTGTTIQLMNGRRYCFSGSAEQKLFVYSYPDLKELGSLLLDIPPWGAESPNGHVWPCFGELPEGFPFRHVLLTMDRRNFPGMPIPNWTYGGLVFYVAKMKSAVTRNQGAD